MKEQRDKNESEKSPRTGEPVRGDETDFCLGGKSWGFQDHQKDGGLVAILFYSILAFIKSRRHNI